MALIGIPVCVVAGWAFASPRRGILSLAAAVAVAAIGVGLAAVFWWPAMTGRAFTRAEASLTGGYYDFHRHFIEGWQFLDTHWNFGISGGSDGNQMPLQIGLLHLFAGLEALIMVLGRWQGEGDAGRRRAIWSVVGGVCVMAIGAFMCSSTGEVRAVSVALSCPHRVWRDDLRYRAGRSCRGKGRTFGNHYVPARDRPPDGCVFRLLFRSVLLCR